MSLELNDLNSAIIANITESSTANVETSLELTATTMYVYSSKKISVLCGFCHQGDFVWEKKTMLLFSIKGRPLFKMHMFSGIVFIHRFLKSKCIGACQTVLEFVLPLFHKSKNTLPKFGATRLIGCYLQRRYVQCQQRAYAESAAMGSVLSWQGGLFLGEK